MSAEELEETVVATAAVSEERCSGQCSLHYDAVILDLDGTVADPAGAITHGMARALEKSGLPVPAEEDLEKHVGPSLFYAFSSFEGVTEEIADQLVKDYRAWYWTEGLKSARPYEGMVELIEQAHESGIKVALATSKPIVPATEIIKNLGLSNHFTTLHGAEMDDAVIRSHGPGKERIVRAALDALGTDPDRTVMVGDRHFDIEAGQALGLATVGVRWGFAPDGELEAYNPDAIVSTAAELRDMLMNAYS